MPTTNSTDDRGSTGANPVEPATHDVTSEVGSEGGSPGDVEIEVDPGTTTGSEAGETARPAGRQTRPIVRDAEGVGRRSP